MNGSATISRFVFIIRIILGYNFLRSAFAHLGNQYSFLAVIYDYKLTSPLLGVVIAEFLPFWQMVLSISLLFAVQLRATFLASLMTFAVFAIAQGYVLMSGLNISCGCFGTSSSTTVGFGTLFLVIVSGLASMFGFAFVNSTLPTSDLN